MRAGSLLAAAALSACAALPSEAPAAGSVTLQRGPCFGRCPSYSVSMNALGEVVFTGERDVAQPGEHRFKKDPAEYASLLAELKRLGAFELRPRYTHGSEDCRRYATDMPSVRITLDDGQRQLAVQHDLGCRDAPEALTEIESLIDQRTGAGIFARTPPSI